MKSVQHAIPQYNQDTVCCSCFKISKTCWSSSRNLGGHGGILGAGQSREGESGRVYRLTNIRKYKYKYQRHENYAMDVGKVECDTNDTSGYGARGVGIWRALGRKQRPNLISKIHVRLWTARGIIDPDIDQMHVTGVGGRVFGTNSRCLPHVKCDLEYQHVKCACLGSHADLVSGLHLQVKNSL